MPRIAESTIDRIKSQTDLIALIQSRGTTLKKQGSNWTGLCPFHDDKETPNLIVTPSKGLFRCMASQCGKTGNAIQFVQWFDGVSFRHACDLLTTGGKAAFEQTNGKTKIATVPKLPCPLETKAEDGKLLGQVADYYHGKLDESALDYLAFRGLDDEALVKRFQIGFSDRTLGLRIPHNNRKEGEELRSKLKALGVYRQNGREHLRGCLTIPITNMKGEVVQIYGRRIDPRAPKTNRHLYLARKLGGVFNPEALKSREIILCESLLDALTFYRHGMEAVTCTYGTENFTDELFEALLAAKVESIRFAYDNDEAGERAFLRDAERVIAHGMEAHRIKFRWGWDANSTALDQGGEALRQAGRNAIWYGSKPTALPQKSAKSDKLSTKVASSLVAKEAASDGSETVAKKEGAQPSQVKLDHKGDHHEMAFGERLYRVGGLEKNNSLEVLRITLRVAHDGLMHVDSLDLYRDGERRKFIDRASEETLLEKNLLKRDLGKLLLALEQAQEKRLIHRRMNPKLLN